MDIISSGKLLVRDKRATESECKNTHTHTHIGIYEITVFFSSMDFIENVNRCKTERDTGPANDFSALNIIPYDYYYYYYYSYVPSSC